MKLLLVVTVALCAAHTEAQEQEGPRPPTPPPAWVAGRLEQLAPSSPESYFLLGEEVADLSPDMEQEALARRLFVLAYELDRARGPASRIAGSCCLALAGLERLEPTRRWLLAVAGAVDPRYARTDWSVAAAPLASDEVAFTAATALGQARAGEGIAARKLLSEPGVLPLLRSYERALSNTTATGAVFRVQKYASEWPCRTCDNKRVIPRTGPGGVEYRICPNCGGNPGPKLSEEELLVHLRFEAALLRGIQRSWSAQIAVDQAAPLRDPDPAAVAPTYGVDPALAYYRAGQWVARPGSTP
ncbi:MAG: hypothetical protein IT437_09940 [Phycisphaerales bacterium]|nr:hypothetical protein [Phycisphaerales bacterium]